MPDGIFGVVGDGLGIDPTRRGDESHCGEAISEFIECLEIRRRPEKDVDKRLLCLGAPIESSQKHGAFDLDIDRCMQPGNLAIQVAKPCLLSRSGCPTALAGHRIVP
jgi:hypothetical protein